MWVKICQDLRHRLLHQVVDVDGVHILVINDVQQVVQLIAAAIDDAQTVARKVVGIECTNQDADDKLIRSLIDHAYDEVYKKLPKRLK